MLLLAALTQDQAPLITATSIPINMCRCEDTGVPYSCSLDVRNQVLQSLCPENVSNSVAVHVK